MRIALILAVAILAAATASRPARASDPGVVDTSFTSADGAKTLQQSVTIDAPVSILWRAFTDPAEFRRWNAPVAAVDLRVGGTLEASYDPSRKIGDPDNIKHRILTFLPERLIVFQNIQAPRALAHADLFQRTVIVLQYEPLGPTRTRVTLSCTGWGTDPESAKLYGFFETDNASLLRKMKTIYEGAPTP